MWFKKEEKKDLPLASIKAGVENPPAPQVEKPKEEKQEEPPLFIKLEKYRSIVAALGQLKATTQMIRSSINALAQLQKTQAETLEMIRKTLEALDKKLNELSSAIVKPSLFPLTTTEEYVPPETYEEVQSVDATIASLKAQIEQLKQELSSIGP